MSSVLRQHVYTQPDPLGMFVSDVDPRLEALVMSLLAKRPDQRDPHRVLISH